MNETPPPIWKSMQDFATRVANEQSRLWQDYLDTVFPRTREQRGAASPSRPSAAVAGDVLSDAGERTARLFRDFSDLTVRYYRGLFEAGRSYAEAMAQAFTKGGGVVAGKGSTLEMDARVGQEAAASFFVENRREGAMKVELEVSPFSAIPGPDAFDAGLVIEPPHFTLGPGEERRVTLRLPLDGARFKAGTTYLATLASKGDPEVRLLLRVNVHEPKDAAAPPPDRH
ncbi:MAG TPA: hypothetical protein VFG53_18750 [Anaeromyxobacter sp.]|nr:hypothetical protein [Anaeromyxobacter sp.]